MTLAPTPPPQAPPVKDSAVHVLRIELLISYLLRIGVITSLLVVVTGMVLMFSHHPDYFTSPQGIQRLMHAGVGVKSEFPHTIMDVLRFVARGRGQGVVMLGLLLLVATPVARVAISVLAFLFERDRTYVLITLTVLALLLLSFAVGGESRSASPVSTQPGGAVHSGGAGGAGGAPAPSSPAPATHP